MRIRGVHRHMFLTVWRPMPIPISKRLGSASRGRISLTANTYAATSQTHDRPGPVPTSSAPPVLHAGVWKSESLPAPDLLLAQGPVTMDLQPGAALEHLPSTMVSSNTGAGNTSALQVLRAQPPLSGP